MIYEIPLPARYDPEKHHAGMIHNFLTERGVVVASVSITRDGTAVIDANVDPRTVLGDYEPPIDRTQEAKDFLEGINFDTADLGQLRNAMKAIRYLVT